MLQLAGILRPLCMNYATAGSNTQTTPYELCYSWQQSSDHSIHGIKNLAKLKCNKTVMFKYSRTSYSFSLRYNVLVVRTELTSSTILLHIFPVLCFLIIYSSDKLTVQQHGAIQLTNYQADIMYGP